MLPDHTHVTITHNKCTDGARASDLVSEILVEQLLPQPLPARAQNKRENGCVCV
jgi:hypothetical protein